jgi:hypothetical protein
MLFIFTRTPIPLIGSLANAKYSGVQLILGFGLLGRRRNQSNKKTARKAGMVVKSSCTSSFLSRVHCTGCRLEMVEFTAVENLKDANITA